jgi:hypothetical protein
MLYRDEEVESMRVVYPITTSFPSTFCLTAKKQGTIVVEKSGKKWESVDKPCFAAALNTA